MLAEAQYEHDWRHATWFVNLMRQLLSRTTPVMSLFAGTSVTGDARVCVRATLYEYELARRDELAAVGRMFGAEYARNDFAEQRAGSANGVGNASDVDVEEEGDEEVWWFRRKVREFVATASVGGLRSDGSTR